MTTADADGRGGRRSAKTRRAKPAAALAPPTWARSQAALAEALGYSRTRVYHLVREPWWPARTARGWHVERCKRALAANVSTSDRGGRRGGSSSATSSRRTSSSSSSSASAAAAPASSGDRASAIADLRRAEGDVEACAAGFRLVRLELAAAAEAGEGLPTRVVQALESTSRELRRAKKDHLALQRRAGATISTAAAVEAVSELARRFVLALDEVEALAPAEVATLLGVDLDADRARELREWFRGRGRALREAVAAELVAGAVQSVDGTSDQERPRA